MAWTALTVVTQAGHKKRWNVLAAAGLRGLVRLLHVQAGFCCGLIRGHKKAIATLCFSPTHETHLFSKTLSSQTPQGSPGTRVLQPGTPGLLPRVVRSASSWRASHQLPRSAQTAVGSARLQGQLTQLRVLSCSPNLPCGLGGFSEPVQCLIWVGTPSSLGVVRWYLSHSCLVWGTFGSSRIRTGGPGVLSPSLRNPVSAGMRPTGGSGAFSGPPLSFPSPRQRPPMTSASSSGTLGHPTRTMNSRPGDAVRQDGPGWGVGTPESVASHPASYHMLAATCSHWIPPPPPCASALLPPARMPTCWLAARVAAAAGMCGWTSPRRGGECRQGVPQKPVLRAEQLQVQGSDPRHSCQG